jgi:spore maturation protein SpmB
MQSIIENIIRPSLRQGMKTALWLLKLTIPVSFAVFLLDYSGALNRFAQFTGTFFHLMGLPDKASIILITAYFTNIYSAIGVMTTLNISFREGIILANMCLIAHSLIIECGIQKKTGSSPWRMAILRIAAGFMAAWLLNMLMPSFSSKITVQPATGESGFMGQFLPWLKSMTVTSVNIVVLVNLLLILQKILSESGFLKWLEKPFYPVMRLCGLPARTSFLWVVAYILGLSYGGAIMISQATEGQISRHDADLLNHHIALSHSQVEDTLLFAAMGLSLPWLVFPRFVLAVGVVWFRRIELYLKNRIKGNRLWGCFQF